MKIKEYAFLGIRALLTLAFLAAGLAKLAGAEMMIATYETIGIGQWFRYLTGAIEVGGAVLLWVPAFRFIAAAGLTATMIGAVLAHVLILGPSAVPAMVLGILSATLAWNDRHNFSARGTSHA